MKKICCLLLAVVTVFCAVWTSGCVKNVGQATIYDIEITYADGKVTGVEKLDFYNGTENSLKELKFNLHANAFREGAKYSPVSAQSKSQAYYKGESYGDMQITAVKADDKLLKYSVDGQDKTLLTVELDSEIYPTERAKITVEYVIKLADVIARTGVNNHTVNLANFYPILCAYDDNGFYECLYYSYGDPYYSDCADYRVTVNANKDYTIAASGEKIMETQTGDSWTRVYELSCARSFALVLSKEFECITDSSTGVEINYYFYDDQTPTVSMETAVKSIKLFNEKFGGYPYPTYSVVQTEFIQGGMEFPGLVMISDGLEKPAYQEVIVHETAHQWWQTVVGNNEIEYGFLDEGLAEYSVVVFYENYPEYNMERQKLISATELTYRTYCSVFDKLFGGANTAMLKSLKDFNGEYEYVNLAYIKPCIMFEYLRQTVGEKKFFGGLQKYYGDYKFKNATPYDLVGAFEKIGADTNGFFESFFDGKAVI